MFCAYARLARTGGGEPTEARGTHLENSSQPNLCRAQSPDGDEDTNGQADNSQELYRARNGDPTQGEDTSAIYLERSIFASEARGGVSDYDSNNDGWSLLGKTDALNAGSIYNLLAVLEDPLGARTRLFLKF